MSKNNHSSLISAPQKAFAHVVHWVTIASSLIAMLAPVFIMANTKNNIANPHNIFAAVFEGKDKDFIWQNSGQGFPGGHFYLQDFLKGDAIAQFSIALGCSVALWAFIPALIKYLKSKDYVFAGICLFDAMLIILSMFGIMG